MGEVCRFLIGPFGSAYDTGNYVETPDYRYVRGQDVKPFFLQDTDPRYMDAQDYERLKKYALKEGDILISVVGTLGNAAIVRERELPAIFSCKSTVVRTDQTDPYFLLAYLNSKYGRQLLLRKQRGAVQKGLNLDDLRSLDMPLHSCKFAEKIREITIACLVSLEESRTLYTTAQQRLLHALKFEPQSISVSGIAEKPFSTAAAAGRLDAEYYQPKYDDLLELLDTKETVGSLCLIFDKDFMPVPNTHYPYIELANVGRSGIISNVEVMVGDALPSRARRRVKAGQVIVSSIEGSLQSCALIPTEYDGALCSNGFYVLDSSKMNAETLLVLFQSEPIQELMRQRCSGTILSAISKDAFLSMPLPLVSVEVQQEIAAQVQQSFALRRSAEQGIAAAVRSVEIAVEEDEAAALSFLAAQG